MIKPLLTVGAYTKEPACFKMVKNHYFRFETVRNYVDSVRARASRMRIDERLHLNLTTKVVHVAREFKEAAGFSSDSSFLVARFVDFVVDKGSVMQTRTDFEGNRRGQALAKALRARSNYIKTNSAKSHQPSSMLF